MKNEDVGRRLKMVGMAMEFKSTRAFADYLGVDENILGKYLRGARRVTLEPVIEITNKTTYTIDFLYKGDRRGLNDDQKRKLANVEKNFDVLNVEWLKRSGRPK